MGNLWKSQARRAAERGYGFRHSGGAGVFHAAGQFAEIEAGKAWRVHRGHVGGFAGLRGQARFCCRGMADANCLWPTGMRFAFGLCRQSSSLVWRHVRDGSSESLDFSIQSAVQRLQYRFRVRLRDAQEGAGGSFGTAVSLFPVLEGAGADADEACELALGEAELFAHGFGVGPFQSGGAGRLFLSTKDGTALLQAGGELLEEFVVHGNSVSMMDLRALSWAGVRFSCSFFG